MKYIKKFMAALMCAIAIVTVAMPLTANAAAQSGFKGVWI